MGSVPLMYQGSKYKPGVFVPIPGPAVPHFSSAEVGNVDATTIVVTFDRDIQADENDFLLGVTIKVNGSAATLISSIRQTNHTIVYYALTPAVISTDVITWEYAATTGIIVSEADSTPLADVTAQSVTNNVLPAPLLDLEADTLALNDGDPVATWADQSGHGYDFTQTTGSAQPTKQTIDGYPAVVFDGTGDYLLGDDWAAFDNMDSFTIFAISRRSAGPGADDLLTKAYDGNDPSWYTLIGGTQSYYLTVGTVSNYIYTWIDKGVPNVADNVFAVATFEMTSRAESHIFFNGSSTGEVDESVYPVPDYSNDQPVRLGKLGTVNTLGGYVRAIRLYSPALNSTDRAAVEAELAARYGITL